jgi:hypothetical protein
MKAARVDLIRSAIVARDRGLTQEEWLAYEELLPGVVQGEAPHVAVLVWTEFIDDTEIWDEDLVS